MSATPARLMTTLQLSGMADQACWNSVQLPHQRTRPSRIRPSSRTRRRLKPGVRTFLWYSGYATLALSLVLMISTFYGSGLVLGPESETGPGISHTHQAEAESLTFTGEDSKDVARQFKPLGIRPAGYLLPDHGSEVASHAGG